MDIAAPLNSEVLEEEEIQWECDLFHGKGVLSERVVLATIDSKIRRELFRATHLDRTLEFGVIDVFDDKRVFTNFREEQLAYHITCCAGNLNPTKGIIIIGGISGKKIDVAALQYTFLKQGFLVLIFDHRGVGENRNLLRTFGPLEAEDIVQLSAHIADILPNINFGIFAPCLGAQIAMMAAPNLKTIKAFAFEGLYPDGERMLCLLENKWAAFVRDYYLQQDLSGRDASPLVLSEVFPDRPLRVTWGGNDFLVSPEEKQTLLKRLQDSSATVETEIVRHAWHSIQFGFPLDLDTAQAYYNRTADFFQRYLN